MRNNKKFIRCFNCQAKPATIKCFDCEDTKLCYNCDSQIHNELDHHKEIIPYDQMIRSEQTEHSYSSPSKVTESPIKELVSSNKKKFEIEKNSDEKNAVGSLSSAIKSRLKRDDSNKKLTSPLEIELMPTQLKSIEFKYRIKFQVYENTISLLKQHINTLEVKHKDNIQKMREQLIKAQEEIHSNQQSGQVEIAKLKRINDDRLQNYMLQLEQESTINAQMQNKIEDLRANQQLKIQDLQQQIAKFQAEIERSKMNEEKIIFEYETKLTMDQRKLKQENDAIIADLKQKQNQEITKLKTQISEQFNQIQQLNQSLREIDNVWQRKIQQNEIDLEDTRQKYQNQSLMIEKLKQDLANLQQENSIYQKENDLFQREKENLYIKLDQMTQKSEKYDKFIYGNKKSRKN